MEPRTLATIRATAPQGRTRVQGESLVRHGETHLPYQMPLLRDLSWTQKSAWYIHVQTYVMARTSTVYFRDNHLWQLTIGTIPRQSIAIYIRRQRSRDTLHASVEFIET